MGINKWALEKWIEALRSGEYKQGYEALCNVDPHTGERYYCCLGVVIDILNMGAGEWGIPFETLEGDINQPYSAPSWKFDITCQLLENGWGYIGLPLEQDTLVKWNDDDRLTFDEIADRLEEYLHE